MSNNFHYYEQKEWALNSALLIQDRVEEILRDRKECSIMLTGGESAKKLYLEWSKLKAFESLSGLNFFFGDERCVPVDHPDSNYGLALKTLFANGCALKKHNIFRMEADNIPLDDSIEYYNSIVPSKVDILLLGIGSDGHIASIFPNSPLVHATDRSIMRSSNFNYSHERMTITPKVIISARNTYVLLWGNYKKRLLDIALEYPDQYCEFPARLVLNANWLIDDGMYVNAEKNL
jgi:6-phosphogluconolactonase